MYDQWLVTLELPTWSSNKESGGGGGPRAPNLDRHYYTVN